jgi:hypothetical protein
MSTEITQTKLDILWDEGKLIDAPTDILNDYLLHVSNLYSEDISQNTVNKIRVSIIISILQQRYFISIKRQNTLYAWVIFLLVAISTLVNFQTILQNMSWIWYSLS